MSGNSPVEPPPEDASFPTVGNYEVVLGPGDPGYVEPAGEAEAAAANEPIEPDETQGLDDDLLEDSDDDGVAELDGDLSMDDGDDTTGE